jgi:hypothetical protein
MAGLLIFTVLGGVAWSLAHSREPDPAYLGKPLSYWVGRYGIEWEKPNAAVRCAGTNAIPLLLRLMRANDSALTTSLIELADHQRFIKVHFLSAEARHYRAACGFEALGLGGESAVPELLRIYNLNLSPASQDRICESLVAIGSNAPGAISVLARATTNSYRGLELNALRVLSRMRDRPDSVVPALTNCLAVADTWIQAEAVVGLRNFGPEAKAAVPQLLELRDTKSREMTPLVNEALKTIDPAAAASVGIQ